MCAAVNLLLDIEPLNDLLKQDEVDPREFRQAVITLHDNLMAVADAAEEMHRDGWWLQLCSYGLHCHHDDVETPAQAAMRLWRLGIDPSLVDIPDCDHEEDEDVLHKDTASTSGV